MKYFDNPVKIGPSGTFGNLFSPQGGTNAQVVEGRPNISEICSSQKNCAAADIHSDSYVV